MVVTLIRKDADQSGPKLILDVTPEFSLNMCEKTRQKLIRIFRFPNLKAELRRKAGTLFIRSAFV
jgi:hypothetical protein